MQNTASETPTVEVLPNYFPEKHSVRFVSSQRKVRGEEKDASYIELIAYSMRQKKMVRRRLYKFHDRCKTGGEKQLYAEQYLIPSIESLLQAGYVLNDAPQPEAPPPSSSSYTQEMTLLDTLRLALYNTEQQAELAPKSVTDYRYTLKVFEQYCTSDGREMGTHPISMVTQHMIAQLITWVRKHKTATAYNKFCRIFSALLNRVVAEGVSIPVVFKAKKQKVVVQRNSVLRKTERLRLEAAIEQLHPKLLPFVMFMQYAFLRPNEARLLRVGDINTASREIIIASETAKNRHLRTIRKIITKELQPILAMISLEKYPPSYYVFGRDGLPSPHPYSINYFSTLHRECVKAAQLNSDKYNLYSWRGTGAYRAISEFGYDILFVMKMMPHSNIATTQEYLKSIGIDHVLDTVLRAERESTPQASLPPTTTAPSQDLTTQLSGLAVLFQNGLLSGEEFSAAKAKLLRE